MGLSARAIIEGLSPAQKRELERSIIKSIPREACGLVLLDANGEGLIKSCDNLADQYHAADPHNFPMTGHDGYVLDPLAIVAAEKRGARLVGIWHSHVGVGAYFSAEDVQGALVEGQPAFPGVDFVVFDAQHDGVRGYRVYRHAGGKTFAEVED